VALAQAAQPVRVRGTVASLDGTTLKVKARTGEDVTIKLADNWSAAGVIKASLADIKQGTFVGIAAMPGGTSLRALEVLVFPDAMRGSNEGHYPWDLQPESTMTNATVSGDMQSGNGRELTLTHKNGETKIAVGPDVSIVTFAPAERSDVKPGAAVFVGTQRPPDGTLQAARVLVGKDGTVPPM